MGVVLETQSIIKDFPAVRALNQVSFVLEEGQIHALCGENGAGKSTLINVLSGVYTDGTYEGQFFVGGKQAHFRKVSDASDEGIVVIHQELSLFGELSVMENVFVGNEIKKGILLDRPRMYLETAELLARLKMDGVSPDAKVGSLGVGQQQLVEIARALRIKGVRVLILDEPTASLTETETNILLDILLELKATGVSIIYISHKLDEVMRIADYITVLRDGKSVGGGKASELTKDEIVRMMVGRVISEMYPVRVPKSGDMVLEVRDYSVSEYFTKKQLVKDAGFHLKRGEILGFYGLIGAGRTEFLSSVFGSDEFERKGTVLMDGKAIKISRPADAITNGIFYCTEDRKVLGIIPTMDIRENTTISQLKLFSKRLFIDQNQEIIDTNKSIRKFRIKTPSTETKIVNLSGGNQQKVLLGRSVLGDTRVLILDEPTRGIDVGAKQEIYSIMNELADSGLAIIMISSELPEILGVSDRVVVMHQGEITGVFDNTHRKLTQEEIMVKAAGV